MAVSRFQKSSMSVFALKGMEGGVEAFGLKLFFGHEDATVSILKLNLDQKRRGSEILRSRDEKALQAFSREFGQWSFVMGIPNSDEGWPGYLGGGIHGFFHNDSPDIFDNLQPADRFYLSVNTKVPPSPPFVASEIQLGDLAKPF